MIDPKVVLKDYRTLTRAVERHTNLPQKVHLQMCEEPVRVWMADLHSSPAERFVAAEVNSGKQPGSRLYFREHLTHFGEARLEFSSEEPSAQQGGELKTGRCEIDLASGVLVSVSVSSLGVGHFQVGQSESAQQPKDDLKSLLAHFETYLPKARPKQVGHFKAPAHSKVGA